MSKNYSDLHRGLVLKYFWQVIRQYKVSFFTTICVQIGASALDIIVPYQYLRLWKVLTLENEVNFIHARSIIFIILSLNILRWGLRRVNAFTNDYFQGNVMAGLRKQAFSYMMGHSSTFFANSFGGSLVQKINKYARAFEKLMEKMLSDGLPLVVRSIGTIIALYILVPKYSAILSVFAFVFILTSYVFTRFKLKYDIIAAELDSKTVGVLADAVGNHSSIQFFTGHEYENNRVGEVINEQKKATVFNWYLWDALFGIQGFYSVIIEFLVFWIAIGDWHLGLITLPIFILLQTYLVRLIENLWNFGGLVRTYYDSFADAQEMAVILDTPYEVGDISTQDKLSNVTGVIEFKDVTYVYDRTETKVLDGMSLTIPSGQKIAIVGSSGAGKSTFVRLLMRLFNLTSGGIYIDGTDISKISQENLREHIAFVPQDPILFHRTLMENIRYGKRDATDEEVKNAAVLAHCDEFIDRLPYGYETYVGERGVKLSGGERQRVAIARAILKNAPILVLDEATSALDSHSESLIQDALHTLMSNKTTIVIAHRLSTVRAMDRIIVIDKGIIVEDGTHDKLLKKRTGIYKKLWNLQAGGFNSSDEEE
jgi:ATP-binding cassette, subfamily B, bacterial